MKQPKIYIGYQIEPPRPPPFNVGDWEGIILLQVSGMCQFYLNRPTLSEGRGKIANCPNPFVQDCSFAIWYDM